MLLVLLLIGTTALASYAEAVPTHIHSEIPDLRIFGGHEATPHSAPYMVYLTPTYPDHTRGTCAGSILSRNYFLTAAHCLDNKIGWGAIFGAHDITDSTDPIPVVRYNGSWTIHPKYSPTTRQNDIAIVRIPSGIPLNKYMQPVKLPSRKDVNNTYLRQTVRVYGWGNITRTTLPKVLMTVDLKVSPLTDCKAAYFKYPITNKQLCTYGAFGKSTCKGDSGTPIMYGDVQLGVLSFGDSICGFKDPEVNTRVDQYLDWIQANSDVIIH